MTRPKPDPLDDFRLAESQMSGSQYAEALDTLSNRVLPLLNKGMLTQEQRRGFHLMRARALYLGQKERGIARTENYENITAEYERASKEGASLQPQDEVYIAEALVATGKLDDAMKRTLALSPEQEGQRVVLLKEMIEKSLEDGSSHTRTLDLLTALTSSTTLSSADRLWALSRQARLMIAQGYYEDATTKILRTLPRIATDVGPTLRGEVLVTLARAYLMQGDFEGALQQLRSAQEAVEFRGEVAAEAMVLEGQALQHLGHSEEALVPFQRVLDEIPATRWRAEATLGAADVGAALAHANENDEGLETAIHHYEELVDEVNARSERGGGGHGAHATASHDAHAKGAHAEESHGGDAHASGGDHSPGAHRAETHDEHRSHAPLWGAGEVSAEVLGERLMERYHEQFEAGSPEQALRFASLGESLYEKDDAPPELLFALATVRRAIADGLLTGEEDAPLTTLADADPATQRQARELLLSAGDYFQRHAGKVASSDVNAYAQSLWDAADSYDRAGDTEEAVRQFQTFVGDFPSDSRHAEAKFRLGQAYRARGEAKLAAQVFTDLVSAGGKGPYADASYVPLAQTLLSDDDKTNDAQAEELLGEVLSGRIGGTGSPEYRRALLELGDLCYRTGRHEQAAERFEEYLDRVGEDADADTSALPGRSRGAIRFKLADAYRLSAREVRRAMQGEIPESDARELDRTSRERLARAAALYEEAISEVEGQSRRSALDDVYLRNAFFYVGDCAFDQGDYETAVRRYEAARERYPKDPASLVAMMQIVSAYLEQGEPRKAGVANAKARKFYESLPESVWDDPTLPLTRREWERWLDAQGRLARAEAGEG
jgi:TolA-binding protein